VPIAGAGMGAGAAGGGAGEGSGSVAPLCPEELRPEEERDCAPPGSASRASAMPVAAMMSQGAWVGCMKILDVAAAASVRHNVRNNVTRRRSFLQPHPFGNPDRVGGVARTNRRRGKT
jgi:hypothetical protein